MRPVTMTQLAGALCCSALLAGCKGDAKGGATGDSSAATVAADESALAPAFVSLPHAVSTTPPHTTAMRLFSGYRISASTRSATPPT